MNEREYLAHYSQVTADNVTATIESRNDDDTFMVREIGTRALVRASKANPVDEFKSGSRVIITRPSASRSVIGAGAVIISRAPRDQRGLSETTPAESVAFSENVMIISVDPDPLVLVAGGEPGEQTIIGRGFVSGALYVGAGGESDDPTYEETTAAVITSSKIVMTIAADADSPTGDFNALVGTAKARNALRVLPRPPGIYPPFFIVSAEVELVSSTLMCALFVLDPVTLEEVARLEVVADRSYGLTWIDPLVYWITRTGSNYSVRTFNPATGAATVAPLSSSFEAHSASELVYADGALLFSHTDPSGADKGLWSFDLDGTGDTKVWADPSSGSTGRVGIAVTTDAIYLTGFNGTARLDRVTFAQEAINATPVGTRIIAVRAWTVEGGYGAFTGEVCLCGSGANVRWLDAADLSVSQTFNVSGGNFRGPVQIQDHIFFFNDTSNILHRATLDGTTVIDVETIAVTIAGHGSFNTDGTAILFGTSTQTVRRVGVDGALIIESAVLDSSDPSAFVDLLQTLYVAG